MIGAFRVFVPPKCSTIRAFSSIIGDLTLGIGAFSSIIGALTLNFGSKFQKVHHLS
jgi:hypothetical protein